MAALLAAHRARKISWFASRFGLFSAGAALTLACTGSAGTSGMGSPAGGGAPGSGGAAGSSAGTGSGASSGAGPTAQCAPGASFASARLSLISDEQYRNVVKDVFGVTFPTTVNVSVQPSTSGMYPYNENAQVQTTTVQAYQRAADEVATLLTTLPTCTTKIDAACMEQYLRSKLPLAWRRPVTEAEFSGLMAIFNSGAMDGQTRQVQLTIEAALLHPAFLYRSEIGTNAASATGKVPLTPYELASAVSFAALNSAPDAELWAKAQDGTLTQPAVLAAQVTRLMSVPQVQANLLKKVSYYLDFETLPFISKDATAYPEFNGLRSTLYQSSQLFLSDIVWNGHFNDLFTSRRVYANQAMATAFGLPAVTGTDLKPVTTTGAAYSAGVLTQPALLAASNKNATGDDVVHRGLWIHDNLLCAPALPPPPANATAVAATITGSSRQQAITRDTGCGKACHGHFDPFGLVTLNYDSIGRYRTMDPTSTPPGAAIDTSAAVTAGVLAGSTADVGLANVDDLARIFAGGRQVSDCAAASLATYTLDHSPEVEGSCEIQTLKDRFQKSGSFSDLFTAILTSPAFLTRDIAAPSAGNQ